MPQVVITVIGDDRAGLVDKLSEAITRSDGNWERSHLAELAGKFAGVVVVRVPEASVSTLEAELREIRATGLLDISLERAKADEMVAAKTRAELKVVGQDHVGIVYEISHVLAELGVSIDELETAIVPAPMGGKLFEATAMLEVPERLTVEELAKGLEAISHDLMIDLDVVDG